MSDIISLTHYRINYFTVENSYSPYMNIPSSIRFSVPKLHTSALAAILYMFMTQPHPPISELAIVMALSWQPLDQTGIKASPPDMGALQR